MLHCRSLKKVVEENIEEIKRLSHDRGDKRTVKHVTKKKKKKKQLRFILDVTSSFLDWPLKQEDLIWFLLSRLRKDSFF